MAKRKDNSSLDQVTRFQLGNGASLNQIHRQAKLTSAGLRLSTGIMVNYQYDLARIEKNNEAYAAEREMKASLTVPSQLSSTSNVQAVLENA